MRCFGFQVSSFGFQVTFHAPIFHYELNETFEKCAKITETIGNFLNVIPAKAGIHDVLLWIPDISLREIPE